MMWFNKHHPNALYLDLKPECEPDIIGDFRELREFPNESFRLIVFDPPHLIKSDKYPVSRMVRKFGGLNADTWRDDLKKGFLELWRLLKPYGILITKWSNFQISSDEFLKMAPVEPLVYQISANKYLSVDGSRKKAKCGTDTVQTLWFTFMKIPEETKA
jgi:23S rRNA G2069 N7-methylase RlmK/C1962 C5-methylase RlmI